MTNLGFRILPNQNRPSLELIESFRPLSTSLISDSMNRAFGAALKPYHKEGKLLGSAITVKTRPGDNLLVHKAIDLAEPGDVIVVDAAGKLEQAIIGEIMISLAKKRGIAGFVIDGAIRDSRMIMKDIFPVYARGVTHQGPYKDGPGEINVPITIDGTIIHPGDLIVGDEDGVVAIPLTHTSEVLKKAKELQLYELKTLCSIADGTIDQSWVDDVLRLKGCKV